MRSSEPARKKVKLAVDIDVAVLQGDAMMLVKPVDITSDACDTCDLAESTIAATGSQSFTVLVLDTESRLFVTG